MSDKRFTLHYITAKGEDKYINFKHKEAAQEFVDHLRNQLRTPAELV